MLVAIIVKLTADGPAGQCAKRMGHDAKSEQRTAKTVLSADNTFNTCEPLAHSVLNWSSLEPFGRYAVCSLLLFIRANLRESTSRQTNNSDSLRPLRPCSEMAGSSYALFCVNRRFVISLRTWITAYAAAQQLLPAFGGGARH